MSGGIAGFTKITYERDQILSARKHGYPGPWTLMFFEYFAHKKSLLEISKMLGVTRRCISQRLIRAGYTLRGPGNGRYGDCNPTNQFAFTCQKCGAIVANQGTWFDVTNGLKKHKCNGYSGHGKTA